VAYIIKHLAHNHGSVLGAEGRGSNPYAALNHRKIEFANGIHTRPAPRNTLRTHPP
jgi:hypothetical protein